MDFGFVAQRTVSVISKLEPARVQSACIEGAPDDRIQIIAFKLSWRDIDRYFDLVGPIDRIRASLVQRPFAHFHYEAALFGERDEIPRRVVPSFGWRQRIRASKLVTIFWFKSTMGW